VGQGQERCYFTGLAFQDSFVQRNVETTRSDETPRDTVVAVAEVVDVIAQRIGSAYVVGAGLLPRPVAAAVAGKTPVTRKSGDLTRSRGSSRHRVRAVKTSSITE